MAALIDASAETDLLVIGMIGGSGAEIVLGTVTLDVTTAAHCPVAVIRGGSTLDHAERSRRRRPAPVLLGIESIASDAAAIAVAFDDAERHGSGLTAVHVPRHPITSLDAPAIRDQLASWRSAHPAVDVTVRIGQGNPGLALLHESTGARHLVLGTRGRQAAVRAVLGSVSRFVLRHSVLPVTVVPRSHRSRRGLRSRHRNRALPGDLRPVGTGYLRRGAAVGPAHSDGAVAIGYVATQGVWVAGGRGCGSCGTASGRSDRRTPRRVPAPGRRGHPFRRRRRPAPPRRRAE